MSLYCNHLAVVSLGAQLNAVNITAGIANGKVLGWATKDK
jgi:hypothetical protein